jgi:ankyrin repeat protein
MTGKFVFLLAVTTSLVSVTGGMFGSSTSQPSLLAAVRADDTAVVRKLIEDGANVNCRTSSEGWSALHYAVRNGNPEVVQLLLKAGADANSYGVMEGQQGTVVSVRPIALAEAALDLMKSVPSESIEATLRQGGLDDPAVVKSMTDPAAANRYGKIVEELASASKRT